jgi:aspartate/methionine/tyrosine aminotransferase
MVKIEPFEVEQWMNEYETTPGVQNVAETCVASVSIQELVNFSTGPEDVVPIQMSRKMTYGAIKGSETLRGRIAARLSEGSSVPLTSDHVLVTQGAIVANFLLFYTLVGPGDHVICVYPTYQQLYSVPQSLGAEVSLWRLKVENGYVPDCADLASLAKPNTKVGDSSPQKASTD